MDIRKMIQMIREQPDSKGMGMIASHLGLVREKSLNGQFVNYVDVHYRMEKLEEIINETRTMPGIFGVLIQTASGRLSVGEPVMALVVGGDLRENVFPALIKAVDRIKAEACIKKESFF